MARESTEERRKDPYKIQLKNVRLSFPAIFTPKESRDGRGKPSFQANFLIKNKDKQQDAVWDAIDAAIADYREKNPKRKFPDYDDLDKNEKCFRNGENRSGEPLYEGYEDSWVLAARNSKRPTLIDRHREPVVEADGIFYAGCYVNAIVRIWCQDNDNGFGVRCSLEAIQFYKDGDSFGAAPVSPDEFDEIEDEDDDRGSRSRGSRDRDDDRGSPRGGRGSRDDDRGSSRGSRDRDDDRGSSRGGRGSRDDDRGGRGSRDDDRGSSRGSRDDDRGSRSRRRDEDDLV